MRVKLFDHGYLDLVEHWGSDERIVEAARMSTDKGFLGWGPIVTDEPCLSCQGRGCHLGSGPDRGNPTCTDCHGTGKRHAPGDEKLLRYLWDNKHATPFEMGGMVIEVQAPIMVFREWHRHRTQSYNELSARYTPLPDLNYVPTVERLMLNSKTNKQAGTIKGAEELTVASAALFQGRLLKLYGEQEEMYQWALKSGVPKELARVHLPVGRYSRMRASANLRNWLAFLTLRMDAKAQYEIRMYANEVGKLVAQLFPRTWALFMGVA